MSRTLFHRTVALSGVAHALLLASLVKAGSEPPTLVVGRPAIEVSLGSAPLPAPSRPQQARPVTRPEVKPRPGKSVMPLVASVPTVPEHAAETEATVSEPEQVPSEEVQGQGDGAQTPVAATGAQDGDALRDEVDALPYIVDSPKPVYPEQARAAGQQGKVRLKVLISERGHPQDIVVLESAGIDSLDQAAIRAVRRWRFNPARRSGADVAAWVVIPVVFSLR